MTVSCGPIQRQQQAKLFNRFLSHYLFRDRYGRPGKCNNKGNAEGLVGCSRRNFMVPIPRFATWDAFNALLEDQCRKRQSDVLRGQSQTIGQRLAQDLAAMSGLPAAPFEACDQTTGRVSSQAQVRDKTNDYSALVAYGHPLPSRACVHAREGNVWIRGYIYAVVIGCGGEVIARHRRRYGRQDMIFNPVYYLPLIDRERRMVEPWIKAAKFSTAKNLHLVQLRLQGDPEAEQDAGSGPRPLRMD
jgi:hypothetical protein